MTTQDIDTVAATSDVHRVVSSHPYRVGETLGSALTQTEADELAGTSRYASVEEDLLASALLAALAATNADGRRKALGRALDALREEVRTSALQALDSRDAAAHD